MSPYFTKMSHDFVKLSLDFALMFLNFAIIGYAIPLSIPPILQKFPQEEFPQRIITLGGRPPRNPLVYTPLWGESNFIFSENDNYNVLKMVTPKNFRPIKLRLDCPLSRQLNMTHRSSLMTFIHSSLFIPTVDN